jgi:hypothetical protein
LTVCRVVDLIREYTKPPGTFQVPRRKDFYSWPYYDGLHTGSSRDELNDGDLLAPALLNVNPGIHGFASLRSLRPHLEKGLRDVDDKVDLANATETDMEAVAALYHPLGNRGLLGVSATTLSKVLHRKRPRLIPLHDRHVKAAYVPDRFPSVKDRSWEEYMVCLMKEMRFDLKSQMAGWKKVLADAGSANPTLTPLRAMDIVVWSLGSLATSPRASSRGD